uniref:Glycosyltransferase family 92 protein n=1 Tax=Panagrolaimus superbus TaxID=310955 RepID=A0A914YM69_9BILA
MAHNDSLLNCKWDFFIANCSTVSNPAYFGLTSPNAINIAGIDFETPENEKYPVVMCYAPKIYETRWQQLIFATEIYHHFGVDLQVQYVNSAMKQIMDILKIYAAKKWIKIQEFAYFGFGDKIISDIGFDPMKEIFSTNQHLALSDCVMRYRIRQLPLIFKKTHLSCFPRAFENGSKMGNE